MKGFTEDRAGFSTADVHKARVSEQERVFYASAVTKTGQAAVPGSVIASFLLRKLDGARERQHVTAAHVRYFRYLAHDEPVRAGAIVHDDGDVMLWVEPQGGVTVLQIDAAIADRRPTIDDDDWRRLLVWPAGDWVWPDRKPRRAKPSGI